MQRNSDLDATWHRVPCKVCGTLIDIPVWNGLEISTDEHREGLAEFLEHSAWVTCPAKHPVPRYDSLW